MAPQPGLYNLVECRDDRVFSELKDGCDGACFLERFRYLRIAITDIVECVGILVLQLRHLLFRLEGRGNNFVILHLLGRLLGLYNAC